MIKKIYIDIYNAKMTLALKFELVNYKIMLKKFALYINYF